MPAWKRTIRPLLALPFMGLLACGAQPKSVDALPTGSSPTELRARLDAADEDFEEEVLDEALAAYLEIHDDARGGNTILAAEAAAQIGTIQLLTGHPDEAAEWIERATEGAGQGDPEAWTRILLARGIQAYGRSEPALARGTFVSLYNYCFNHDLTARAIEAADLVAKTSLGQQQLDWSLRAIQAADTLGEPDWLVDLWLNHASYLDAADRVDDALVAYENARRVAATSDLPRLDRYRAEWNYGHGLRRVGRFDEARDVLSEANAVGQSIYVKRPSPRAAEYLGHVIAELGHLDAAMGYKQNARARYDVAIVKFTEAGALPGVRAEIEKIRAAIEQLDAPPPVRRIPTKPRAER